MSLARRSEACTAAYCQEAVGWHDGRLVYGHSGTCDYESDRHEGYRVVGRADNAISAGLRMMGGRAAGGLDEATAAELDRHRFTADWLVENPLSAPPATTGSGR